MNQENQAKKLSNDDSLKELIANFLPYIRRRANRIRSIGLTGDDIVQEGLIGLLNAVASYDEHNTASFSTYAITCIDNNINSALRAAARKKNLPLNNSVSLSETNDASELVASGPTPEEIAIIREEYSGLVGRINKNLSDFERDVLALYLEGYSYIAMAQMLGTSPKAVDNALQRARVKLKNK